MREIPLTKGKVAFVDDSDYEWLMQWKWSALKGNSTWYAVHRRNSQTLVYMHRFILGLSCKNEQGDHRNGNGLDNQRHNLRSASHGQNQHNKKRSKSNTSGFKGVAWCKQTSRWQCHITVNNHQINLGRFDSREEAAMAYNEAAIERFGEFAQINAL